SWKKFYVRRQRFQRNRAIRRSVAFASRLPGGRGKPAHGQGKRRGISNAVAQVEFSAPASDFTKVVATGLWPAQLSAAFTLRRRPTGPWLQRLWYYLAHSKGAG